MSLRLVDTLILEGGGARDWSFIPVIEALEKRGVMRRITRIAGTSAGAIIAMVLALRKNSISLREILDSGQMPSWTPGGKRSILWRWPRVFAAGSLYANRAPLGSLGEYMRNGGLSPGVNFGRFRLETGIDLRICATNELTESQVVFSAKTTPRVQVRRAVWASASIPIYFPCMMIDGMQLSDGGSLNNMPWDVFGEDIDPRTVLCIRTDTSKEVHGVNRPTTNIVKRANILMSMLLKRSNGHIPDGDPRPSIWDQTVRIVTDAPILPSPASCDEAEELFAAGRAAWKSWEEKNLNTLNGRS